jgi:hypothetical protein
MEMILTDDDLRVLERRLGGGVRQMGSWNSDGTFGYTSVPLTAVQGAAELLEDSRLTAAVARLEQTAEPTKLFIELLETFGSRLVDRIVAAYRKYHGQTFAPEAVRC